MANEESEDRQFLGELPESLFKEHEGRFPQESKSAQFESGQHLPPDISYQRQAEEVNRFGRIGTRDFIGQTTTTFDARPINARDFVFTDKVRFRYTPANGGPEILTPAVASFTVPQGYVGILREFHWTIEDPNFTPLTAFITVNNTPVPNYDDLRYLSARFKTGDVPCYILALPGQTIQIILNPDPALLGFDTNVIFYMHGNLLLSRGLPLHYETTSQPMVDKYQDT